MAPTQKKRRQYNDINHQEANLVLPRIRTTEDHPHSTHVESSATDSGNTNFFTARTQVGRRVYNTNVQQARAPGATKFNQRNETIQLGRRGYNGNSQKERGPSLTNSIQRNEGIQVGRRVYNGNIEKEGAAGQRSIRSLSEPETDILENLLGEDRILENDLMSSMLEEEEDEEGIDNEDDDDEEKKLRGPTYMQHIWGRPLSLPPIHVDYNKYGQPIDGEHSTLCHFLGTIARNAKYCPVDVKTWHGMSIEQRAEMLAAVKLRFHVPVIAEKWILASIGCKWKNWKHYLKTRYWVNNIPIEVLMDERDPRVLPEQWEKLLTYWKTEEAQKASDNNKKARDEKTMDHTTGKTSFAIVRERLRKEKGRCATRVESFGTCFVSRNGNTSKEASDAYAAMQQRRNELGESSEDEIGPHDIFAQIMGKDKPGQVRMLGKGVCPSDVWGGRSRSKANTLIMKQQAEIARLRSMLLTPQQPLTSQVGASQDPPNLYSMSSHTTTSHVEVGAYVALQSVFTKKVVAKGCIHSTDASTKVGGQILGENWCAVIVKVITEPHEQLVRPYDNFQKLYQTLDEMIAWPLSLVTSTEG